MSGQTSEGFPLYQMRIGEDDNWYRIGDAGRLYDSGKLPVAIGGLVLDGPGKIRQITDEERGRIAEIADAWSGAL